MVASKNPSFKRQESWRLRRVRKQWRRPRGVTSRMRKEKKGWPARVKNGYGTVSQLKGRHPSGLVEKLVKTEVDLNDLSSNTVAVRLAGGLGQRKRRALLERAKELNLKVLNPGKERAAPVESTTGSEVSAVPEMVDEARQPQEESALEQAAEAEEEDR